jgi:putative hydroxymethylpyrimidine transport system permease protein
VTAVAETAVATVPAKRGRVRGYVREYGPSVLIGIGVIAFWQWIVRDMNVQTYLFPAPSDIAKSIWDNFHLLMSNAWVTFQEILLGLGMAVGAGLVLGVLLHVIPFLRRGLYPILITSQTVPIVVLAPVLVVLIGFNMTPKLVIVALTCFFPIVVNTIDGLRLVDSEYIRMMQTLDASRIDIFRRVEFPSALPAIFTGLRIAVTYGAIGAVFGEWSGASQGLGYLMQQATPSLNTPLIFASIVLLSVMALFCFAAVSVLERLTIPWAAEGARMT